MGFPTNNRIKRIIMCLFIMKIGDNMKRKLFYIFSIILFLLSFNQVKAYDDYDESFEYLYITYDFINSNEYYLTYRFKPIHISENKYYLRDDFIYVDSVEHNIEMFELRDSKYVSNYAEMFFYLDEDKEYYIKYKGFLSSRNGTQYSICINPILDKVPSYALDKSNAVDVSKFSLTVNNPDNINLTKDRFFNISNFRLYEEGHSLVLEGGFNLEDTNRYYNVCFKAMDKDEQKSFFIALIISIGILGIMFSTYMIKSRTINDKNN